MVPSDLKRGSEKITGRDFGMGDNVQVSEGQKEQATECGLFCGK